jgi:Mg2+/citrate symporter
MSALAILGCATVAAFLLLVAFTRTPVIAALVLTPVVAAVAGGLGSQVGAFACRWPEDGGALSLP